MHLLGTILLSIITMFIIFIAEYLWSPVLFFLFYFILLFTTGRKRFSILFCFGSLISVLLYYYWSVFYSSPYFLGQYSDDWYYDVEWSQGFVQNHGWSFLGVPDFLNSLTRGLGFTHNSIGYVYIVAIQRGFSELYLGGHSTLTPRITNIFFLSLLLFYLNKIYQMIEGSYPKVRYSVFIFFLPSLLFTSSHIFRDILISLLLVYFVYILVKHLQLKLSLNFYTVIISIFLLMSTLRVQLLVPMTLIFFYYSMSRSRRTRFLFYFVFSPLLALLVFSFWSEFHIFRNLTLYNELNAERFTTSIISKIFGIPLYFGFIPRVLFLFFTPVPNLSSFYQLMSSTVVVLQILSMPLLFYSLIHFLKFDLKFRIVIVAFIVFLLTVAFSTMTFRHVVMYIPFAYIIVYFVNEKHLKIQSMRNFFYTFILIAISIFIFLLVYVIF